MPQTVRWVPNQGDDRATSHWPGSTEARGSRPSMSSRPPTPGPAATAGRSTGSHGATKDICALRNIAEKAEWLRDGRRDDVLARAPIAAAGGAAIDHELEARDGELSSVRPHLACSTGRRCQTRRSTIGSPCWQILEGLREELRPCAAPQQDREQGYRVIRASRIQSDRL